MGLLSIIGNAIKGATNYVASAVKSIPAKAVAVLDINKAAFTNPISLITKGKTAAVAASNKLTPVQATGRIVTTAAIASSTLLLPTTAIGRAAAASLIPKTVVGKIAAVAAIPITVGIAISSPSTYTFILPQIGSFCQVYL